MSVSRCAGGWWIGNERGALRAWGSALFFTVFLGTFNGPASAAEVVDLPSASGGIQHVWYDAPAHPWAVAIMFAGGNGVIPFEADGSLKGGLNTLVRSRQKWVDQGIAVVIPNRPASVSELNYRLTDAYSHDIVTLIDFASSRWSAPIWLLGHSLGSLAVVSGASDPSATKVAVSSWQVAPSSRTGSNKPCTTRPRRHLRSRPHY